MDGIRTKQQRKNERPTKQPARSRRQRGAGLENLHRKDTEQSEGRSSATLPDDGLSLRVHHKHTRHTGVSDGARAARAAVSSRGGGGGGGSSSIAGGSRDVSALRAHMAYIYAKHGQLARATRHATKCRLVHVTNQLQHVYAQWR